MPGSRTSISQCPLSDLAEPVRSPSLGCLDGEVSAEKKEAGPQFCLERTGKGCVCTRAPGDILMTQPRGLLSDST